MEREKVIKAWEIFRDSNPYEICDGREFRAIKEPEYCMGQMIEDTIAMLKEQEKKKCFVDSDGKITPLPDVVRCKDCGNQDGYIVCGITGESHPPTWFCADGKRE